MNEQQIILKQSDEAVELEGTKNIALDGTVIQDGKYIVRTVVNLLPISEPPQL